MMRSSRPPRPPVAVAMALGLTLLPMASGCGRPPQVARDHRHLVASLATAVSARNPEWLEANARQIEEERARGRLAEAEGRAFASILARARAGDWAGAEDEAYDLRDAQKPTAEDVAIIRKRTLPPREAHELPKRPLRPRSRPKPART